MHILVSGLISLALIGAADEAAAQDAGTGRREFMANCAQCHGVRGGGDGVIAGYLNTPPSDLTRIQRDNGGVFPFEQVYMMIEGTGRIGGGPHGSPAMPAWGDRYSVEAAQAYGFTYTPAEQTAYIHRRLLALVDYVASLQVE